MSVKIRKCDRCGAKIKDQDWDGKYDYTIGYRRYILDGSGNIFSSFDLCLHCRDQLHEWLNKETN